MQGESGEARTRIVARPPRGWRLSRTQILPRPRAEVFGFFADATNLEEITPGFLHFRILTPRPIAIDAGTRLDYRLCLFGVPFRRRTRIDVFEPDERFVDRQVRGPHRRWVHRHEFRALDGATEVRDEADDEIGFGPLGALAHARFVRRSLERVFEFRAARLDARFVTARTERR